MATAEARAQATGLPRRRIKTCIVSTVIVSWMGSGAEGLLGNQSPKPGGFLETFFLEFNFFFGEFRGRYDHHLMNSTLDFTIYVNFKWYLPNCFSGRHDQIVSTGTQILQSCFRNIPSGSLWLFTATMENHHL